MYKRQLNYRVGSDYLINSKNTIGVLINGNIYDGVDKSFSHTNIGTMNNNGKIDSILNANTRTLENRRNTNFNINYAYKDTKGKSFSLDADYGIIRSGNDTYNPNLYMSPSETSVLSTSIFASLTQTDIDIKTLKGDYEQNLAKGRLGLGFKLSQVITDNGFDFFDYVDNVKTKSVEKSNDFTYDERVYAAYVNYNKQFDKKWSLQAGLRLEATKSHGMLMSMNPVSYTHLDVYKRQGGTGYVNNVFYSKSNTFGNRWLWSSGISMEVLMSNTSMIQLDWSINHLKQSGVYLHFKEDF